MIDVWRGLRWPHPPLHLLIAKRSDGAVTRTGVRPLSSDERREEIARMLSGATVTPEARAQAERLLETA